MEKITYGSLLKDIQEKLGYSYESAQAYLASALYVIASDEQLARVNNSIQKKGQDMQHSKAYYVTRGIVRLAVKLVQASLIMLGLYAFYLMVWSLQFPY